MRHPQTARIDLNLLRIYLTDHQALLTGVARRLEQMTGYVHLPFRHEIVRLRRETVAEAAWVRGFARRIGAPIGPFKRRGAVVGELLGRLKLNGRIRSTSPLSPLIEVEMLAAAITVKLRMWESLAALGVSSDDAEELTDLIDHAHDQLEGTLRWHRYLKAQTFTH